VRYFGTFRPDTERSVEEVLRMVSAVREVDMARGGLFTPTDWELGQPIIPNTKAGVLKFYRERHGIKVNSNDEESKEGLLAGLGTKLQDFYESIFGASTPLKHGVEVNSNDEESKEGLLAGLRTKLQDLYETIFGASTPLDSKDRAKFESTVDVDSRRRKSTVDSGRGVDESVRSEDINDWLEANKEGGTVDRSFMIDAKMKDEITQTSSFQIKKDTKVNSVAGKSALERGDK
jgi:hypothetical protein